MQIPFIVPLGLATTEKLQAGAAKDVRTIFNKIQGLLYPNDSVAYMPPLMELTVGGMYKSFYGFITNVTINPTQPDMFQDPCTGQYFHLIYDGTIQFENLFTYYHGEETDSKWNIDKASVDVLFGSAGISTSNSVTAMLGNDYYYGSSDTARAIKNILYTSSPIASRVTMSNPQNVPNNPNLAVTLIVPSVFANDTTVAHLMFSIRNKNVNSNNADIINIVNDALQVIFNNYNTELNVARNTGDSHNQGMIYNKYIKQVRSTLQKADDSLM